MTDSGFQATNRLFEQSVVSGGDFAALARVYTRNARILPPGAEMVTGSDAIIDFWRQASAALGITAVRLTSVTLDVLGDRAQEVGRADLTLAGHDAPMALKYVVLWKREDDTWKMDVDIWNAATA